MEPSNRGKVLCMCQSQALLLHGKGAWTRVCWSASLIFLIDLPTMMGLEKGAGGGKLTFCLHVVYICLHI